MQVIRVVDKARGTPTPDQLRLLELLRKKEREYIRKYLRSVGLV
jgi:hypothetical protein